MPIYSANYSGVAVYEYQGRGFVVMRRRADSWINATHILKVAGFDKGKRTKLLEKEVHPGVHEKVQGGYGGYQGTWVPFERALDLAKRYNVEQELRPLFDHDPSLSGTRPDKTPTKQQVKAEAIAAAKQTGSLDSLVTPFGYRKRKLRPASGGKSASTSASAAGTPAVGSGPGSAASGAMSMTSHPQAPGASPEQPAAAGWKPRRVSQFPPIAPLPANSAALTTAAAAAAHVAKKPRMGEPRVPTGSLAPRGRQQPSSQQPSPQLPPQQPGAMPAGRPSDYFDQSVIPGYGYSPGSMPGMILSSPQSGGRMYSAGPRPPVMMGHSLSPYPSASTLPPPPPGSHPQQQQQQQQQSVPPSSSVGRPGQAGVSAAAGYSPAFRPHMTSSPRLAPYNVPPHMRGSPFLGPMDLPQSAHQQLQQQQQQQPQQQRQGTPGPYSYPPYAVQQQQQQQQMHVNGQSMAPYPPQYMYYGQQPHQQPHHYFHPHANAVPAFMPQPMPSSRFANETNESRSHRLLSLLVESDYGAPLPEFLLDPSVDPDLDLNVDLDEHGHKAIHWAAALAKVQVLEALVNRGCNIFSVNHAGETPLIRAVKTSAAHDHSGDGSGRSSSDVSAGGCFPSILELLHDSIPVADNHMRTVLHHIVMASASIAQPSTMPIAGMVDSSGMSNTSNVFTPTTPTAALTDKNAGKSRQAKTAKYYLECLIVWIARHMDGHRVSDNASVSPASNQQSPSAHHHHRHHQQPLTVASAINIISRNADTVAFIDQQDDNGDTALSIAARLHQRALARILLSLGANKHIPNKIGLTPIDFHIEQLTAPRPHSHQATTATTTDMAISATATTAAAASGTAVGDEASDDSGNSGVALSKHTSGAPALRMLHHLATASRSHSMPPLFSEEPDQDAITGAQMQRQPIAAGTFDDSAINATATATDSDTDSSSARAAGGILSNRTPGKPISKLAAIAAANAALIPGGTSRLPVTPASAMPRHIVIERPRSLRSNAFTDDEYGDDEDDTTDTDEELPVGMAAGGSAQGSVSSSQSRITAAIPGSGSPRFKRVGGHSGSDSVAISPAGRHMRPHQLRSPMRSPLRGPLLAGSSSAAGISGSGDYYSATSTLAYKQAPAMANVSDAISALVRWSSDAEALFGRLLTTTSSGATLDDGQSGLRADIHRVCDELSRVRQRLHMGHCFDQDELEKTKLAAQRLKMVTDEERDELRALMKARAESKESITAAGSTATTATATETATSTVGETDIAKNAQLYKRVLAVSCGIPDDDVDEWLEQLVNGVAEPTTAVTSDAATISENVFGLSSMPPSDNAMPAEDATSIGPQMDAPDILRISDFMSLIKPTELLTSPAQSMLSDPQPTATSSSTTATNGSTAVDSGISSKTSAPGMLTASSTDDDESGGDTTHDQQQQQQQQHSEINVPNILLHPSDANL